MNFRRPLKAVAPTLEGDVLAVLAGAEDEFTGRQVHGLVGHSSERGVRNALERLVGQGVVLSRRAGASKLYRLNPEHLATPWVRGLAGMRAQLVERLSAAVGEWEVRPVIALLFGSVVRGEATEESDIDLLVIRPAGCGADSEPWREQLAGLQRAASAWTGNDARILEYGEAELRETGAGEKRVIADALREGAPFAGSLARLKRLVSEGAGQ